MKKVLITGGSGQLGHDIKKKLDELGVIAYAPTTSEMDITNKEEVLRVISEFAPDVIFHCAAYTAVDKAEEEKERCYDVNVNGTKNITDAANNINAKVVYISTDYVFDGAKEGIYEIEDKTSPINYYGYTKLCGEEIIKTLNDYLIVRISWVFGINGKNFVKTMLKLSETRDEINVVSDQYGSPTYTEDLTDLLIEMVEKNKCGVFHATNEGFCSWYEFAKYIFEINNVDIKVNPILTKDYPTAAKRPFNSKLNKDKIDEEDLHRLPTWQDATKRYCKILRRDN